MPRENFRDRGRRLVSEGRLLVNLVDDTQLYATCRGDSGKLHELGYHLDAGWYCGCEARGRCAHLVALMLVTAAPGGSAA